MASNEDGSIRVKTENTIATVELSRPSKLNSVTFSMLNEFESTVSKLINDANIAAIIFKGDGTKAFSAGFDLETVQSLRGQERIDLFKLLESTIKEIRQTRNCLTVASVNGYAFGFGAILALACDFRIFSDDAIFSLPEVNHGIFPGSGASSNLLHLVGPSRAKDILLTGREVNAQESEAIGIASRVVPKNQLDEYTIEFVNSLVSKDRKVLIRTKTLIDGMTGERLADAAEIESMYQDEWVRNSQEDKKE